MYECYSVQGYIQVVYFSTDWLNVSISNQICYLPRYRIYVHLILIKDVWVIE